MKLDGSLILSSIVFAFVATSLYVASTPFLTDSFGTGAQGWLIYVLPTILVAVGVVGLRKIFRKNTPN